MSALVQMQWRPASELPDVMRRPGRCFVRVEGWRFHSGEKWARVYCGSARTSSETPWGFCAEDIQRLMSDGDMTGIDAITHWMPAKFPEIER